MKCFPIINESPPLSYLCIIHLSWHASMALNSDNKCRLVSANEMDIARFFNIFSKSVSATSYTKHTAISDVVNTSTSSITFSCLNSRSNLISRTAVKLIPSSWRSRSWLFLMRRDVASTFVQLAWRLPKYLDRANRVSLLLFRFRFRNLNASVEEFQNWRFRKRNLFYIRALVLKYGGNLRAYINSASAPGRHNRHLKRNVLVWAIFKWSKRI